MINCGVDGFCLYEEYERLLILHDIVEERRQPACGDGQKRGQATSWIRKRNGSRSSLIPLVADPARCLPAFPMIFTDRESLLTVYI